MSTHPSSKSAFFVMHVQPPITDSVDAMLPARIAAGAAAARAAGIPVFYVNIGFRPGHPEVAPSFPFREWLIQNQAFVDGVSNSVHEAVAPHSGDVAIRTSRVSAFTGTDLDVLLRAKGISHLILTGISTGGVVLSTLIGALERDLQVTVLSDGCADANADVHRTLLHHFSSGAPWHARVITIAQWTDELLQS